MSKIKLEKPTTFSEYVSLIEKYQGKSADNLWYRGCGSTKYKLIPSLYRHKTIKKPHELFKLENKLVIRFKQRSLPFTPRLYDEWETIFFMQHYRIPTRLLDWTENPFIALYFALTAATPKYDESGEVQLKDNGEPEYKDGAVVWILNPIEWNRFALSHQSFDGGVLAPGDEALKGYKPMGDFSVMNNLPVAVFGSHNSPRIVAQRGVFTIYGQKTSPMENIYRAQSFPAYCLVKLLIQPDSIFKMLNALFRYGITESVIFPDLDGLAKEIRRYFNFEV
jgi:hypothetical protein